METGSLHTPGAKPCQPPSAVDKGRGKQPSARLQNPLDLPEHAIRLRQDVQGIGDDHRVEGLRHVGEMAQRLEHRFYRLKGHKTEIKVFDRDEFSLNDNLERFLYSYE